MLGSALAAGSGACSCTLAAVLAVTTLPLERLVGLFLRKAADALGELTHGREVLAGLVTIGHAEQQGVELAVVHHQLIVVAVLDARGRHGRGLHARRVARGYRGRLGSRLTRGLGGGTTAEHE